MSETVETPPQAEPVVPPAPVPQPPAPSQKYWLVIVHETEGSILIEDYESRSDLVLRLRRLVGKGYRVFVFRGDRLAITRPPFRHLVDGDDRIPLFEIAPNFDNDDTGSLDEPNEPEQDQVYRAITRKGLDEIAKTVAPPPLQPLPSFEQPAPPAVDDDD